MARMTPLRQRGPATPALALPALVLLAGVALAGCGSGDGRTASPSPSGPAVPVASTDPAPDDAVEALDLPDGTTLTPAGTDLAVGETATVAWRTGSEQVAVLSLQVTGVQPAPLAAFEGWLVSGAAGEAAPYFVTLAAENVGDTDIGGATVPLFLAYGGGSLVTASGFAAPFEPCPSTPLPSPFAPGATVEGCLVYLAPREVPVDSLAFQPWDGFDPVTWGAAAPSAPSAPSDVPTATIPRGATPGTTMLR